MRTPAHADPPGPSLRALQEGFLAALRDGHDLAAALGEHAVLPPAAGGSEARWSIYSEGYLLRLAGAIENDYPAVARILGPGAFRALCRRYLAAFPPRSHDIGRAGDLLPEHLLRDPVRNALPFLPDLARFESALAFAAVAPRAATWRPEDLERDDAGRVAETPLRLVPSTGWIVSTWPLDSLWLLQEKGNAEVDLALSRERKHFLVWRDGITPRWRRADDVAATIVRGAGRRRSLAEIAARPDAPDPASLSEAFRLLLAAGVFLHPSESGGAGCAPCRKEKP